VIAIGCLAIMVLILALAAWCVPMPN